MDNQTKSVYQHTVLHAREFPGRYAGCVTSSLQTVLTYGQAYGKFCMISNLYLPWNHLSVSCLAYPRFKNPDAEATLLDAYSLEKSTIPACAIISCP
jgi:hypothetical protein